MSCHGSWHSTPTHCFVFCRYIVSLSISTIYKIIDSPTDATFQFGQWYRARDRGQVRGDPGEASQISGVRSPAVSGQKEEGNTTQSRSRFTRKRNLTVQLFRYGSSVLIKHHIYLSGFVIELNCVPSQQQNRQFLIHDFISQGDDVAGHRPRQQ